MARFTEPTAEQEKGWHQWVANRPPHVRAVAERFEPWSLYRMESTGHRVTVLGFDEGDCAVTVRVAVLAKFNLVTFERQVFGIAPEDLAPCDLPSEDEVLGAAMTREEVDENIDLLRVTVRPDLFALDENGKAVRKDN